MTTTSAAADDVRTEIVCRHFADFRPTNRSEQTLCPNCYCNAHEAFSRDELVAPGLDGMRNAHVMAVR